jgi:hypothetical protein
MENRNMKPIYINSSAIPCNSKLHVHDILLYNKKSYK